LAVLIEDEDVGREGIRGRELAADYGAGLVVAPARKAVPGFEHIHLEVVLVAREGDANREVQARGEDRDLEARRDDDVLRRTWTVERGVVRADRVGKDHGKRRRRHRHQHHERERERDPRNTRFHRLGRPLPAPPSHLRGAQSNVNRAQACAPPLQSHVPSSYSPQGSRSRKDNDATLGVNQAAVSRERRTQPRGCANARSRAKSREQERPDADEGDHHGPPPDATRHMNALPRGGREHS